MAQNAGSSKRPQVAVIANIYKTHLHTQHIIDRILEGYGWGGVFFHSPLEVVSLFVEQRGEGDLVPERAKRHPGMKVYPTIAQALTRGTGKLAVDGVIYGRLIPATTLQRLMSVCGRLVRGHRLTKTPALIE